MDAIIKSEYTPPMAVDEDGYIQEGLNVMATKGVRPTCFKRLRCIIEGSAPTEGDIPVSHLFIDQWYVLIIGVVNVRQLSVCDPFILLTDHRIPILIRMIFKQIGVAGVG